MIRKHYIVTALCIAAQALMAQSPAPPPGYRDSPTLDLTWRIGTHNAYLHGNEATAQDPLATGPNQHILDQLYIDRVRALEFDLHSRRSSPAGFDVYHTRQAGYALCTTIQECMSIIRTWHVNNPLHDPLFIHLEAKEFAVRTFTTDTPPQLLDSQVRSTFGSSQSAIYDVKQYLDWCEAKAGQTFGENLRAATAACGWPTLDALRGRILFTLHGNFGVNEFDVYAYTRQFGRKIRDAMAFPMAGAVGDDFPSTCSDEGNPNEIRAGNVCDWNDHSVVLDLLKTEARHFTTGPPFFGNPDPVIRQFKANRGLFRNGDSNSYQAMLNSILTLQTVRVPGYNLIPGDAPRHNPLNYAGFNPGLPPVAAGCLWDPNKPRLDYADGCNPFHLWEPQSGVQIAATGNPNRAGLLEPGDSKHDVLFFANINTDLSRNGVFRTFISTRTESHHGAIGESNFRESYPGRWGCLMAREDETPESPFFAVCRLKHRLNWGTNTDGIYLLWRQTRGGDTQGIPPYDQPHNELDPYVVLSHSANGMCWDGFKRYTDDFDAAAPGVLLGTVCFGKPLARIGLATDGGYLDSDSRIGEYLFANVRYNGRYVTGYEFQSTSIGPILSPQLIDRSYLDGLCAADMSKLVKVTGGGFQRVGFTNSYTQRVTIQNTSAKAIQGPLRLEIFGLPVGINVTNSAGKTTCRAPIGDVVNINLGFDNNNTLAPNASVNVVVNFVTQNSGQQIQYYPIVLGPGNL